MMKSTFLIVLVLLLNGITSYGQHTLETDQIVVKLKQEFQSTITIENGHKENLVMKELDDIASRFQVKTIRKQRLGRWNSDFIYVLKFPEEIDLKEVINVFYKTGIIEYAELDLKGTVGGEEVVPNDSHYAKQWGLHNDGTFSMTTATAGADIDMERAWAIEKGDSNIVVAVIDTGTKLDHPELAGRIWKNQGEIPNNGIDDDGNGFVDDYYGWNFANDDNDPTDDNGHGTNVAGIIGVNSDNSLGFAGVDWNCKLMNIKALDQESSGYFSWFADAVYYAVDNGANVINLSLGGLGGSTVFGQSVQYALDHNVVVVACMMNTNSEDTYYPAAYPGVIAVGATTADDTRAVPFPWNQASGSNYGSHLSVVAPGNYIFGLKHNSNLSYTYYYSGTSQATPHVTGVVSLLLAQDPSRTPAEIKSILESTAEDMVGDAEDTPGWDKYFGYGRINAYEALSYANPSAGDEIQVKEEIHIFPNPTQGTFQIKFPNGTRFVEIVNALGQQVYIQEVSGKKMQSFSLKENGVYFIKMDTEIEVITKKLIVSF